MALQNDEQTALTGTEQIKDFFQKHSEVAVAFSGGVDSAVLLLLAVRYARRVKAYYVQSQFQPQFEREDAARTAALLQAEIEIIPVDILSFDSVVANPDNRCYYCKKAIFDSITAHAARDGFSVVLDGTNASDDLGDRPGYRALQELAVLSPLKLCGYTKAQIRRLAAQHRLPVADKPSYACLATRIPTGTAIRAEILQTTEAAENALRAMGFRNFRVRYCDGDAKLELCASDFARLPSMREQICAALKNDYRHIYLDLKEKTDE